MIHANEARALASGNAYKEGDPMFDRAMRTLEQLIRAAAEHGKDHIYAPFDGGGISKGLERSLLKALTAMGYSYKENHEQREGDLSKLSW